MSGSAPGKANVRLFSRLQLKRNSAAHETLFLLLVLLFSAAGMGRSLTLHPDKKEAGKYKPIGFRIDADASRHNPFDPAEVQLDLLLTTPKNERKVCPAFFRQDYKKRIITERGRKTVWRYPVGTGTWRARFTPAETGRYQVKARVRDTTGTFFSGTHSFTCTSSSRKGFIRISGKDPRFFEYTSGEPFFAIGQNLAFIGDGQYVNAANVEHIFARLKENGANYLRLWTCCKDWALAVEARKSAWGRSWSWKPPFAPYPGGSPGKECIRLAGKTGASVTVSPTYKVALMPETKYTLSVKVKTQGGADLHVDLAGANLSDPAISAETNNWKRFTFTFTSGPKQYWLGRLRLAKEGSGTLFFDELSLRETGGGAELLWEAAINRPVRGFYNPVDCFMLDGIVALADHYGIKLQICLITRDLYMHDLTDPDSAAYDTAIADAKNLLRYAVARWGYATSVAGWEYFNENNPGLPTGRFYTALGGYLEEVDIYGHLRSTSTWHPSARDCRHPKLDLADVHFYLRPSGKKRFRNEVEAVIDRARFLRTNAPRKPALIGEFGLANERWGATEAMKTSGKVADFHNAMWTSVLSGTSGSALFWWWDRLDRKNHYPHYKPIAAFLRNTPWTTQGFQPFSRHLEKEDLQLSGLKGKTQLLFWLFDHHASWTSTVLEKRKPQKQPDVALDFADLEPGTYTLEWWNTTSGSVISRSTLKASENQVTIDVPAFTVDIAGKLIRTK